MLLVNCLSDDVEFELVASRALQAVSPVLKLLVKMLLSGVALAQVQFGHIALVDLNLLLHLPPTLQLLSLAEHEQSLD